MSFFRVCEMVEITGGKIAIPELGIVSRPTTTSGVSPFQKNLFLFPGNFMGHWRNRSILYLHLGFFFFILRLSSTLLSSVAELKLWYVHCKHEKCTWLQCPSDQSTASLVHYGDFAWTHLIKVNSA